jgi:hypothetical protein
MLFPSIAASRVRSRVGIPIPIGGTVEPMSEIGVGRPIGMMLWIRVSISIPSDVWSRGVSRIGGRIISSSM